MSQAEARRVRQRQRLQECQYQIAELTERCEVLQRPIDRDREQYYRELSAGARRDAVRELALQDLQLRARAKIRELETRIWQLEWECNELRIALARG